MKHGITARNKSYFSQCFISFCQILGFPVAFEVRGGHVIEGNSLREFIRIIFMKYKGDIYKDTLPFFCSLSSPLDLRSHNIILQS